MCESKKKHNPIMDKDTVLRISTCLLAEEYEEINECDTCKYTDACNDIAKGFDIVQLKFKDDGTRR